MYVEALVAPNPFFCNINMQLISVQLCCETTVFSFFGCVWIIYKICDHLELNIDRHHSRCRLSSKMPFQILEIGLETTLFQPSVKY